MSNTKIDQIDNHRQTIRINNFDYTKSGLYFITICTNKKKCTLGKIQNSTMELSDFGLITKTELLKTAELRKNVVLHDFTIMPNHIHFIIELLNKREMESVCNIEQYGKPVCGSIPTIVRSFKSSVTNKINKISKRKIKQFWQRNYYEHVIRNELSFLRISEYIISNPIYWQFDRYFNEQYQK